ncbi:hypothetical protein CYLTODRAFT_421272 [Cylindrobasidium torrendii FP15055 ss-10]|uniref:Transmembrane protein 135 N-terminal domain-containing protein n=1 Tax=Cylindrobasidium torrendii FP15055 ss-10 TaxID=1314674 RepID=A0A0D7BEC5_9AGAR|nr:hypothetical protein CYLTODRAFT_421272 [Cylindrobasidium torrendii FP15055 ss-10]
MIPALPVLKVPEDTTHPVQVVLRTYGIALSLSLIPGITPVLAAAVLSKKSSRQHLQLLRQILKRELGLGGFAFAITVGIGGGATLKAVWDAINDHTPEGDKENSKDRLIRRVKQLLDIPGLSDAQRTFASYCATTSIAIALLQAGRHRLNLQGRPKPSRTLDLTLLFFVRAVDAFVQYVVLRRIASVRRDPNLPEVAPRDGIRQRLMQYKLDVQQQASKEVLTTRIDGLVFWACSARIMWCFFYAPNKLPRSYVRWIGALARVDERLLKTLDLIRTGDWSYIHGSRDHSHLLQTMSSDLGHPAVWGNPVALPSHGGKQATKTWQELGVSSRPGLGGIPCEIVHGGTGSSFGLEHSCTSNAFLRGLKAFTQCVPIYIPVHFLPPLLSKPRIFLNPHRVLSTLLGALRSAGFLTTFIASYWYAVCLTRSKVLARLLPFVSHDFWDGPYGCIMAGCLACGSSIWIEHPRRRGEMAMYVLPRAIRTLIPEGLIRGGNRGMLALERIVFIASLSFLITVGSHKPECLRGLSRWASAFVLNGPNAAFWQSRRTLEPDRPPTPSLPPTPKLKFVNDTLAGSA